MPQEAQLFALDTKRAPDAVSDGNAESLNVLFSALTHALRIQVLRVMRADSFSVSELCAAFSVRQSALSHHLKILTDAGFLARRHEGTATFYRRQLPEGRYQILRQQILDEIDEESMPADLASGLQAVQRLREGHSAAFFRDRGKEIRKQQEAIASWEDYSRATLHLLDRAGNFGESALIEVGPGDGALLGELAQRAATVCALDNSEEMLHAAQHNTREISNIEYHLGEPKALLAQRGTFAAAVVNMVLHHVVDPTALVRDTALLLRPGGELIISDLCPHDQAWAREHCGDLWLGFSPEDLRAWATAAGLEHCAELFFAQRNGFQIQVQHFKRC
jgi:2-polyprenyl-3-methyl-5-hydroxy-6-metoxy-1,4-benzoquinol methylase/DNA-binding MarR family transcriptional regulator